MIDKPMPAMHFTVQWGGEKRVGFTEVTGLKAKIETIEYREGSDKTYTPIVIPGLVKYGNVVLKRGIVLSDNDLFEWFDTVGNGKTEERNVVVALLNEDKEPAVQWKLAGAFPVSLLGPALHGAKSRVAIETLELAHQGITVEHASS